MKKEEIEKRKTDLQKQHDDLTKKIAQGKEAIANMEATLMGVKGAIAQADWTLGLFKEEKPK
jgi:peptidoglycan hydrolase CwlO-like protein